VVFSGITAAGFVGKANDGPKPKYTAGQVFHGEPPSKVIRINAGRTVMSRPFGSYPSQQTNHTTTGVVRHV
jgi:hypothetical protein